MPPEGSSATLPTHAPSQTCLLPALLQPPPAPPPPQQDASLGSVATVVLRGSTEGFLDDVERAVDDGVNAYKVGRGVPGAAPVCMRGAGARRCSVKRRAGSAGRRGAGGGEGAQGSHARAAPPAAGKPHPTGPVAAHPPSPGPRRAQALCKDARMLAGGGAAEIEVARRLAEYGRKQTGLDQYAIAKFAEALEVVPRWA
jgi:hypothetical protein